ncbi:MAG: HAD family phosphatase [Bacteroidales bacterium]|nr:HAD family phosphatase [Bacteroidales bacterium]
MENIRNIIFDLGGVLYNIDQRLSLEALKNLGLNDLDRFLLEAGREQVFERFDRGEISPIDFRQKLRKLSGLDVSDEQIDAAWNAMLLDFPEYRIDLLEGLRGHYRLFLLSNTNAIHYPHYQRYMQQTFGVDGLDHLFEKTYLSHQLGMRKPDAEVYIHILKENELLPEETLFIDDTLEHVLGARKVGLKAVWLDLSKLKVTDLFNWRYQLRPEVAELL